MGTSVNQRQLNRVNPISDHRKTQYRAHSSPSSKTILTALWQRRVLGIYNDGFTLKRPFLDLFSTQVEYEMSIL